MIVFLGAILLYFGFTEIRYSDLDMFKIIRTISLIMVFAGIALTVFSVSTGDLAQMYGEKHEEIVAAYNIQLEDNGQDGRKVYYTDPKSNEIESIKINSEDILYDSQEEKIIKIVTTGPWADLAHVLSDSDNIEYKIYLERN